MQISQGGIDMTRKRRWIPIGLVSGSLLFLTVFTVRADYREGIKAFQNRDYTRAAEIFQGEVESAPNYSFGWYMLGMISLAEKDFAQAEIHFNKAIEIDPNKFSYYQGQAKLHADQEDHQKAVDILEERQGLAETDRDKLSLHSTLGNYYAKLDNHAAAVEHLEQAKTNPPSFNVCSQLGISYYSLGDYDKAIENLKTALAMKPNNEQLAFFLGSSYLSKAKRTKDEGTKVKLYDEAVRQARQLVLVDDKNYQYHNLLARSLFGAKRFGDSIQGFNRVLSLKPDYCYAYTNIGKVYVAMDNMPLAEGALRKGIECDNNNHLTYEVLATVLENEKKLEESLQAYQDAQDRRPTAVSLEGVERVQAKITNRDLDQEQAKMDADADARHRRELEEYKQYQKNLEKFDEKYGNKPDDENEDGDEEKEGDDAGEEEGS
jgi:tetratricopeptide (TPR) repeat protein